MRLREWFRSVEITRRLRAGAPFSVRMEHVETALECIYREYRGYIDALMSYFWQCVEPVYCPSMDRDGQRQVEQRRWLVLRSLMSCCDSKCRRRVRGGLERLFSQCRECEKLLHVLTGNGMNGPTIRSYARQEVERLAVSTLLDAAVTPALSHVMQLEIDSQILKGCTLYVMTREICWLPANAEHRLSYDLWHLLDAFFGASGVDRLENPFSAGTGVWMLNTVFPQAMRCRNVAAATTLPKMMRWPSFPHEWRMFGEQLSDAYPRKFRRPYETCY